MYLKNVHCDTHHMLIDVHPKHFSKIVSHVHLMRFRNGHFRKACDQMRVNVHRVKVKLGTIYALLMCIWNASRCSSFEKFKCTLRKHIGNVFNTHQPCIYVFNTLFLILPNFEIMTPNYANLCKNGRKLHILAKNCQKIFFKKRRTFVEHPTRHVWCKFQLKSFSNFLKLWR